MNQLAQISAITLSNLRGLPQRWVASLVVVVGIAGVVGVLLSILAGAISLNSLLAASGKPDRYIVLDGNTPNGSDSNGRLPRAAVLTVLAAPGIARDAAGQPIASAETVRTLRFDAPNGKRVNASVRGVGPGHVQLRPEIHLIEGRMFQSGLHELVAGVGARRQTGMAVGNRIHLRDADWTVVGIFQSNDSHDSEFLGDADTVLTVLRTNIFQSVSVRIDTETDLAAFKAALEANPQLKVSVVNEVEYYRQRVADISGPAYAFAVVIAVIMGLGAVFGALNTMYAAVAARAREIATLRAIGFNAVAIVVSLFAEAMLLALSGGALGALITSAILQGHTTTAVTGNAGSAPVTFTNSMSPGMFIIAVLVAVAIGFIGGLFPAIRAARLPVATALQVR